MIEGLGGTVAGYPMKEASQSRRLDITLRENLNAQIEQLETRVAELKSARDRLSQTGILDSRIDDIQHAMRW